MLSDNLKQWWIIILNGGGIRTDINTPSPSWNCEKTATFGEWCDILVTVKIIWQALTEMSFHEGEYARLIWLSKYMVLKLCYIVRRYCFVMHKCQIISKTHAIFLGHYITQWLGVGGGLVPLRWRHFLFQKLWHIHKNIISCNICVCTTYPLPFLLWWFWDQVCL